MQFLLVLLSLNSRGPKGIKSPSEREARLRIRMSANQSFDYNIEIRRRGEKDAWFHLPVANRNRNPVQTATIDIYYVDRGEPNWPRTRPLRALKSKRPNATNPSYLVHSALRDLRFPSRILLVKYFALATIPHACLLILRIRFCYIFFSLSHCHVHGCVNTTKQIDLLLFIGSIFSYYDNYEIL